MLRQRFLKINTSCLYTCKCRLYLGDRKLRGVAWTLFPTRNFALYLVELKVLFLMRVCVVDIHCVPSYNFIGADLRPIVLCGQSLWHRVCALHMCA